ncbi:MliC family protein [Pseudothauera nasutitermitis]|nr:MliC family protein [Pseudothauera nasutitermitis]
MLRPLLPTVAVLASATVLTAGVTHARDNTRDMEYQCPSGERFAVEHHSNHVRVRTGSGVFALAPRDGASGAHYSDGGITLWTDGTRAALLRPDMEPSGICTETLALHTS